MHTTRRTFVIHSLLGGAALASSPFTGAQTTLPMLEETDAQAVALHYRADGTKAEKTRFPNHTAAEICSDCSLYQGKAGAASGTCVLFPNKRVAAAGWCSAWTVT